MRSARAPLWSPDVDSRWHTLQSAERGFHRPRPKLPLRRGDWPTQVETAAVAAALALAIAAAARGLTWQTIIAMDSPAGYSMAMAPDSRLNVIATTPQRYGTGFQVIVGGRVEEVTACHLVCYQVPAHSTLFGLTPAHWDLWPQVDIGPMDGQGLTLSVRAFDAASTTLYPNADVAVSTVVPHVHRVVIQYTAPKPAVQSPLTVGNFLSLRRDAHLLVLGNHGGTWTGARPNVAWFTYEGVAGRTHEARDFGAPFPNRVLPVTLVLCVRGIAGMSGAPVIDAQGQAVGVFVVVGAWFAYAVPLDPSGLPVGGVPVKPAGAAE